MLFCPYFSLKRSCLQTLKGRCGGANKGTISTACGDAHHASSSRKFGVHWHALNGNLVGFENFEMKGRQPGGLHPMKTGRVSQSVQDLEFFPPSSGTLFLVSKITDQPAFDLVSVMSSQSRMSFESDKALVGVERNGREKWKT
ncbi:hypothetical protein D5086_033403 [Populus alba]|uniref:Uncharacterized protein n=2 Tax=Populus TaxID=3689 RepID=A0ACC4AHL1_POPAL|nr:hypothetical protein NC653_041408 [Populus alba x Populus x berolinensis]